MRGILAFWSISIHAFRMPRFHREMAPWQSASTILRRPGPPSSAGLVHRDRGLHPIQPNLTALLRVRWRHQGDREPLTPAALDQGL